MANGAPELLAQSQSYDCDNQGGFGLLNQAMKAFATIPIETSSISRPNETRVLVRKLMATMKALRAKS